ncbi:MAG: gamma-glutamyl-gamma-aminobutyrate hydrolase family protein [Isosphaeraceae bacterium]
MKWNIPRYLVEDRLPRHDPPRAARRAGPRPDPDGINGPRPGGPGRCHGRHPHIQEKSAAKGTPIFGICLGHQLLGQAFGARTFKLKFGHRGANHPVRNEQTGKVEITTQNHGFAVDPSTLPPDVSPSHINLNDQTLEGLRHRSLPVFSVQYHPEASAGPHDSAYLFDEFRALMNR